MGIFHEKFQRPLLYILLLYTLVRNTGALSPDGQALVNFRTNIVSSDGVLLQWRPEDPDPCGWKGVTCDPKSKRVISLSLSNHKLSGPISSDIGKLENLQFLALYDNNLYGNIPPELGYCTKLQSLYLQGNYLSGVLPYELGNFTELLNLDISSNSLSGSIPPSLEKLDKLQEFNVSTNFLVGPIPSDGVLDKFTRDSFVGNRGLCGKQISVTCKDDGGGPTNSHSDSAQNQNGKKKNSGRLLISAFATVGALLLVALMCFWGCFLYKKFGKTDGKSLAMDVSGGASIVMFHGDLPYTSKDIIKKLENLNEEHIIGIGGFGTVYKLAMDDGDVFALKRILKLNEGFDRFFERELEILGSIKHRYLVNLRGYCNSPTSKLLIYDFLPGGSLDEALHVRAEQLDWDARLNIIMGAAKGLAYLHHDCSPRIIHRDIKSSNILLDGNLEARVSDFGLAKLLEDEESHITTIVAGTFGYLAPEYMQSGRATEKTDVYSFGVLVLEVLSGKRPTDASFIEKGLNIVGWKKREFTQEREESIKREMKIQCDVCGKAPATVICCADEAALCAKCDTEVHAANKLASKHQRLLLQSLSNKLPTCDICQEKPAFIFCVEDRAMFCQDCDEPIHSAGSLAANHQRFLATGIRVALSSKSSKRSEKSHQEPPPSSKNTQQISMKTPTQEVSGFTSPSWAVDDLLHFSDFDSSDKKEQLGFGEHDWFSDIGLFGEQVSQETAAAAEVPQLPVCQSSNTTSYRPTKYYMPYKKPRLEIPDDDDEHFTVPDLG